jgi:protein SCO1/2
MIFPRASWRALGFLFLLLLAACRSSVPPSPGSQASHAFAARGVIEHIAPDRRQVTIHHDVIPGYMMEMTMDFPVHDPGELKGLIPGDKIAFTLTVEPDTDWVGDIHRIGHMNPASYDAASMHGAENARLKPGDTLPDGELVAEDGRHIHLSDFHGKAVALTFFFTRCPLPTYCPLMNRNFAQTRRLLLSDPKNPANWELLSISFDPDFDKPGVLSSYAGFFRDNNPDHWLFAAAPPATLAKLAPSLGLVIVRQDSNISHNLRTVVIDPQGRLYRQFSDNLWTPRQLADAILAAAGPSKNR